MEYLIKIFFCFIIRPVRYLYSENFHHFYFFYFFCNKWIDVLKKKIQARKNKTASISLASQTDRSETYLSIYPVGGGGGHWSNNNTWPTLSTSRQSGTTRREVILHSHHHVELLPGHSGWLLPTQQSLSGSELHKSALWFHFTTEFYKHNYLKLES